MSYYIHLGFVGLNPVAAHSLVMHLLLMLLEVLASKDWRQRQLSVLFVANSGEH